MPKERFYIEKTINLGDFIEILDKEFHHLTNVMRLDVNDEIEIINGKGSLGLGIIRDLKKKSASIEIQKTFQSVEPQFKVILAQAIPRINRLDFILEKGTELGMTSLWLFPGDRSERVRLTEHQLERMRAITISAMKQCGRLFLPEIDVKPNLKEWNSLPFQGLFGDVQENTDWILAKWQQINPKDGVIFFIGPESGLCQAEINKLNKLGAIGVKMHRHILRTDTAALTALSIIEQLI